MCHEERAVVSAVRNPRIPLIYRDLEVRAVQSFISSSKHQQQDAYFVSLFVLLHSATPTRQTKAHHQHRHNYPVRSNLLSLTVNLQRRHFLLPKPLFSLRTFHSIRDNSQDGSWRLQLKRAPNQTFRISFCPSEIDTSPIDYTPLATTQLFLTPQSQA